MFSRLRGSLFALCRQGYSKQMLEPFWTNFAIIFVSLWDHVGIIFRSIWNRFGIIFGSIWDQFGIILGLFSDEFGIILGSFRIILGSFLIILGAGDKTIIIRARISRSCHRPFFPISRWGGGELFNCF